VSSVSLHNYGQSTRKEKLPSLKVRMVISQNYRAPKRDGVVRDRKGEGKPPTVVVVLPCQKKKTGASVESRKIC